MKERAIYHTLFLTGLLILLAGCVSKGQYDLKVNEAVNLQRNLTAANQRIDDLSTQKKQLEEETSDLNGRLIEMLRKNSELQQTLLNELDSQPDFVIDLGDTFPN